MKISYLKHTGISIIIIFSFIPLLLWLPYSNFNSFTKTMLSVGQALGLSGSVLFSINFILAGRFRFLEAFFGGLNRIYIIHHIIGAVAFIFLLYHPVFVALFYIPISVVASAKLLFSTPANLPVFWGFLALLAMIITLILTFFIKLPYHVWKYTHKFLGLALFFASLHMFFIPSTISKDVPLRYYILTFAALGIISYLYRVIFHRLLVKRLTYQVKKVSLISKQVVEIDLFPNNASLNYLPGQFVFISFSSDDVSSETHPFSLISQPEYKNLSLAIKYFGKYTESLKLLKIGSSALVEGPFGLFTYSRYSNTRQIWIAGGIGVTPFLGMARSLKADSQYRINLYYVVGNKNEAVYLNELINLSAKIPGFQATGYYSKIQGRFNADKVASGINDYKDCDIFVCGPPPMMKSLRSQFKKLGVKNSHIHTEEFSLE